MKNRNEWVPTKYALRGGVLVADPKHVGAGSLLFAGLVAEWYGEVLPRHCRGRLLDLGCGKAPFNVIYESLTTGNVCVDWPNSLHGTSHADIEHDLGKPLPLPDGEFDTVLLSDVLEHVEDPDLLLTEICRVLRPGGCLIMNVPFLYWLHEIPHDNQRLTEFALKRKVEAAGMAVEEFHVSGGAAAVLADVFGKAISTTPRRRKVAALVQRLALRLQRRRWVRDLSVRGGIERFPLGYCLVACKPASVLAESVDGLVSCQQTVS